jgi:hypothetical protein
VEDQGSKRRKSFLFVVTRRNCLKGSNFWAKFEGWYWIIASLASFIVLFIAGLGILHGGRVTLFGIAPPGAIPILERKYYRWDCSDFADY